MDFLFDKFPSYDYNTLNYIFYFNIIHIISFIPFYASLYIVLYDLLLENE